MSEYPPRLGKAWRVTARGLNGKPMLMQQNLTSLEAQVAAKTLEARSDVSQVSAYEYEKEARR